MQQFLFYPISSNCVLLNTKRKSVILVEYFITFLGNEKDYKPKVIGVTCIFSHFCEKFTVIIVNS